MTSNYEYREGGRIWIITEGRYLSNKGGIAKGGVALLSDKVEIKKI